MGAPVVVLVWLEPGAPEQTHFALHQLAPGTYAQKIEPRVVQETSVNGQPAFWTKGPYMLEYLDAQGNQYTNTERLIERTRVDLDHRRRHVPPGERIVNRGSSEDRRVGAVSG
jgi:hypothetical protein